MDYELNCMWWSSWRAEGSDRRLRRLRWGLGRRGLIRQRMLMSRGMQGLAKRPPSAQVGVMEL